MFFEVSAATSAVPGRENEDYYLAAADWALILDGVAPTPGVANGCVHGVRWFVERLANAITAEMLTGQPLSAVLRRAIEQTAIAHGEACDLSKPLSPAATVGLIRHNGESLDWLVLGDTTLAMIGNDGSVESHTDDRLEHLPNAPVIVSDVRRYDPAYVASVRNKAGGFWVASSDAQAADQALTGTAEIDGLSAVGLFTDGLSRLVERYGRQWPDLFSQADKLGPGELIRLVRQAETNDEDPTRWRGKAHDDATCVLWHFGTDPEQ